MFHDAYLNQFAEDDGRVVKNILVDAIPFDHGASGISVYVRNVVRALENAGHDVTVLVTREDAAAFPGSRVLTAPRWASGAIGSILYHMWGVPRLLRDSGYDFCLVTAANRRFPARCPIPVIGTVHDLAQCQVKGKYGGLHIFYLNHILVHWVRLGAARVVAISRSTLRDIEMHWEIPSERIVLIYNGLSLPEREEPGFLARYGLTAGHYILYVSRLEHPGKNHLRLMQAYEQLPRELTDTHALVLVGSPWKDAEVLEQYAAKSPLRDRIIFTGFVPEELLPEAYRSASLYIFPSCYEGFGLSLVEAMHYGVPCCCSDNSSLGEIGRGAAQIFSPDSVEEIRDAMQTVLEDRDGCRAKLIDAGRRRAMQFDWRRHVAAIVRVYEENLIRRSPVRELFGIYFDAIRHHQAAERMIQLAEIARHEQAPAKMVVTVNVQILVNARYRFPQLLSVINGASLVVADGAPLVVLSRIFTPPGLPERITGSDLIYDIAAGAAAHGLRVYFLGGEEESVTRAIELLRKLNPSLVVAGRDASWIAVQPNAEEQQEEAEICRRIVAARTDILLVGLGNPKQELFVHRNAKRLPGVISIGLGGTFNFLSGRVRRAPRWMQKIGMEWFFRVLQEPRRLFLRYFIDAFFLFAYILEEPFRRRKRKDVSSPNPEQ